MCGFAADITKPFRQSFALPPPLSSKVEAWVSAKTKTWLPSYASAYRGDSPVRGNVCDSRQKGSRLPEEKRRRALCATEGNSLIFILNGIPYKLAKTIYYNRYVHILTLFAIKMLKCKRRFNSQ